MSMWRVPKTTSSTDFAKRSMTAVERWRSQLEGWAVPHELLDAVPWNPYEWPAELFARRDAVVSDPKMTERHTNAVISQLRPMSLIDIGAGAGGSCLDLAAAGIRVTAVEPDAGMAAQLRSRSVDRNLRVGVVEMAWPAAADAVGAADVVTSSHVIYNVPDPGPFLAAMHAAAGIAVVIQEFETHPWVHLRPYYMKLHQLERPMGPTVADLVAVIEETLGVNPTVERWYGGPPMWFVDRDELLDFYGRRLVVPVDRRDDLEATLGPSIVELGAGRVQLEERQKSMATIWWRV